LTQRIIIHADLDYFYAQCEEIVRPELRGKPVVVCVYSGRTAESGVVSTSNYEARKYGVKAGIPIAYAKKMLASIQATFLAMNMTLYEEVSTRIMNMLRTYGDSFEKVSIDEAYLDISNLAEGNFDKAKEIAIQIKEEILQKEQVTCSVGVAPNKLLAKMASDYKKPDGLTILQQGDVAKFIERLPVNRIPGVGKKVEEKLNEMHVSTIDELVQVDPVYLIERFGKNLGNYLFQASRGEDNDPVKDREQPTQLSRIATLKQNSRDPQEILPLLNKLARSVLEKLNEEKMECKSVSLIVILTDLSIHTKSMTLESPTKDLETIVERTKTLLERFVGSMPNAVIRRVGVRLSGLQRRTGQTDIVTFLQA
jgi:DNA polymerase IV (DinB-like DNA polymerase)